MPGVPFEEPSGRGGYGYAWRAIGNFPQWVASAVYISASPKSDQPCHRILLYCTNSILAKTKSHPRKTGTKVYNTDHKPSPTHSRNDIRLLDNSADLVQDGLAHGNLLPDHGVVLVVGVVGVPQLAAAGELELHELVPELALVAHTGKARKGKEPKGNGTKSFPATSACAQVRYDTYEFGLVVTLQARA